MDEINRVVGVLDTHLGKSSSGWLVGDKISYVDLFYVMWGEMVPMIFGEQFKDKFDLGKYPHYKKWFESMKERESVKKVLEDQKVIIGDMMAGKYP
jgi:glutathione S-transferase